LQVSDLCSHPDSVECPDVPMPLPFHYTTPVYPVSMNLCS